MQTAEITTATRSVSLDDIDVKEGQVIGLIDGLLAASGEDRTDEWHDVSQIGADVAMIALGLHLYHGAWSSLRTLGYARASAHPLHRRIALVVAVVVWIGFTLVPVGVIAGIIR